MPLYEITKSDDEINAVLNNAAEVHEEGTRFHGMSYEQGVEDALLWLFGDAEQGEWPFPDEG